MSTPEIIGFVVVVGMVCVLIGWVRWLDHKDDGGDS